MEQKNGFDINFLIGILLIFGIIWFMGMGQPAQLTETVNESDLKVVNDVAYVDKFVKQVQYNNLEEEEERYDSLSNNLLSIKFSNFGASIKEVVLKEYLTHDSLALKLVSDLNFSINFVLTDKKIQSNQLLFKKVLVDTNKLVFTYIDNDDNKIEFQYELIKDSYELKFDIITTEGSSWIEPENISWTQDISQLEKNLTNERNATTIRYSFDNKNSKALSLMKDTKKDIQSPSWIAYKQQFFSTILYSRNPFKDATLETITPDSDDYVKTLKSILAIPYDSKNQTYSFTFYFVPNKYALLKDLDKGFESLIALGWGIFGWVNKWLVIPIFNFLEGFGLNYGIIIFIIALIFKLILFFPTKSSYVSMAKMRVLKPEIDAINEKIKDPMAKQQAQMSLYKKTGVNPMGGCLPLFFQMPILIALFQFFPSSIELRQQPFLWAEDLSTYDSVFDFGFNIPLYGDHISLFALLMTAITLLQMMYSNQMTPSNTQMPQMKYIMYFMPVVFLFVMNNYSAALSYYYFLANLITFGQQALIRRSMDDDKLYAMLQANKKKPVKKSKFQQRLEDMARKSKKR